MGVECPRPATEGCASRHADAPAGGGALDAGAEEGEGGGGVGRTATASPPPPRCRRIQTAREGSCGRQARPAGWPGPV